MTKTKVREEPPLELPAARLFLDDIKEIIRVLKESRNYLQVPEGLAEPALTIRVGDWECDSVEDLRDLGKKSTSSFYLQVANDWMFHTNFYLQGKDFAGWADTRSSDEGKWAVYGQLHAILKKRETRWPRLLPACVIFDNSYEYKSFAHSLKRNATKIALVVGTAILTLLAQELVQRLIHHGQSR
jgi:hypothetical protein